MTNSLASLSLPNRLDLIFNQSTFPSPRPSPRKIPYPLGPFPPPASLPPNHWPKAHKASPYPSSSRKPTLPPSNRLADRLTNSVLSLGELARSGRGVLLRNALIETGMEGPGFRSICGRRGIRGLISCRRAGAITEGFRAQSTAAGAEIVSYVPNNAYLVRGGAGVARAIEASPLTQAVLKFEPYYKLDAALLRVAVRRELSPYGVLNVVSFPGQGERMLEGLKRLGAEAVGEAQATVFGDVYAVRVPADRTAEAAQVPEVQMLGVRYEKRPVNDLTRAITRISTNILPSANVPIVRPPESHYQTASNFLTGAGVLVAVADTGVDDLHPDLTGRIEAGSYGPDYDGHGTHVVGDVHRGWRGVAHGYQRRRRVR